MQLLSEDVVADDAGGSLPIAHTQPTQWGQAAPSTPLPPLRHTKQFPGRGGATVVISLSQGFGEDRVDLVMCGIRCFSGACALGPGTYAAMLVYHIMV